MRQLLNLQLLDRDIAIGVDADICRDVEGTAHDGLRIEGAVNQGTGGRKCIIAARSNAHDARFRFQHIAGAGEDKRYLRIRDNHHGFEPAQITIGAPILGEFDRSPGKLTWILLELGFQALEQGKRIRGRACEPADDVAFAQPPYLFGIGLDDGLTDGNLAVAPDGDRPILAYRQYGGAVPNGKLRGGLLHDL